MIRSISAFVCVLLGWTQAASAQVPLPTRLQTQVRPAFRITPMVHRLEAPRGKLLEFEFEVESLGRPTSLKIRPVGLRQQENGVIMPAEDAPLADAIQMMSPAAVELDAGEKSRIRGRLQVPRSDSTFHSFGILVKDLGRPVDVETNRESGASRVGIKFVTQYLLRCDVAVTGVRGGDVRRLEILSGELVQALGKPKARVWISNPTDSFLEFGVRCQIAVPESQSRRKPFSLILPVRQNVEGPERYVARILPGSRVRLEEFVPEAIFPGAYDLEVQLLSQGRRELEARFPIVVGSHDFPAQRVAVLPLTAEVSALPAQIELSLRRRGQRYRALTLVNNSPHDVEVRLDVQDHDGSAKDWLLVRPAALTLPSRSSRKALVSIGPSRDFPGNRYGRLNVSLRLANGHAKVEALPVAVLGRGEDMPKLSAGPLMWQGEGPRQGFVVGVLNEGDVHLPLNGKLILTGERDRSFELRAGFGRWLLPGQSDDLTFRLPGPLPPGTYRCRGELNIGAGRSPVTLPEAVYVQAATPATAAEDGP
jgi:hypothetical protein